MRGRETDHEDLCLEGCWRAGQQTRQQEHASSASLLPVLLTDWLAWAWVVVCEADYFFLEEVINSSQAARRKFGSQSRQHGGGGQSRRRRGRGSGGPSEGQQQQGQQQEGSSLARRAERALGLAPDWLDKQPPALQRLVNHVRILGGQHCWLS